MKTIVKRIIRDEKGAALVVALILLLVGGLISASLLGYMGSGLLVGEVYDTRTAELYAADAGVEDAIWSISHQSIPPGLWQESSDQPGWWIYEYPEPLIVNGRSVQVEIYREDLDPTCGEELRYQILSTAATFDGGNTAAIVSSTAIESYVSASYMDFSSLLDYAIVSQDEIDIRPNNYVDGDVWLPDDSNLDGEEYIADDHTVYDSSSFNVTWPDAEALSSYYLENVNPSDPYLYGNIDIKDTKTIESCYREGDLTVDNTGDPDTLVLEGTVYVRGNLDFEQAGAHNYTVDLKGQTIFVEGNFKCASQSIRIAGSGCIIAVGDIVFQPSISSEPDDFILILSIGIGSTVQIQPSGSFTGCIAGNDVVGLQPGDPNDEFTLRWIDPEGQDLDFPMGIGDDPNELPPVTGVSIESWEIEQQ